MQNKLDITLYLRYFIFPAFSLITLIIIYVLLILPYLNVKYELDTTRDLKNTQIKNYEAKLAILKNASNNKDLLDTYQRKLVELVPNEDTPAPLVGYLDSTAVEYRFTKIDDNRNTPEKELADAGILQVLFNGRTVGPLSALNFITAINSNNKKIINIRNLELFNDRDQKFYRVSFNARTIFNKSKSVATLDNPVPDLLNDAKFTDFMKNYIN